MSFSSRHLIDLDCPACTVDRTGIIHGVNPAFVALTGAPAGALTGLSLRQMLPASEAEALIARLRGARPDPQALVSRLGRNGTAQSVVASILSVDTDGLIVLGIAPLADGATLERHDPSRHTEDLFRRTLLELGALIDNASVGILFTRDRVIQRCNQRLAEIFGYPAPDALVGKPGATLHIDADRYREISGVLTPLLGAGAPFHDEWQGRKADGTPIWTEVYGRAVDPNPTDQGTLWILEDIDRAKHNEVALQKTLREMEAIMKNAAVGVGFTRQGHLTRANAKFHDMFGYDADETEGLPARVLYRSDDDYQRVGQAAAPLLSRGKPFQMELWMRRKDGTDFWANLIGYVLNPDHTGEGTIWICEDRSDQKRAEDALRHARDELEARVRERTAKLETEIAQRERAEHRLKHLALHDSLTGLPNRTLLRQHIISAVEQGLALNRIGAVLFIDIDRFKNVNDTLGHHVGDMLLREVAQRISRAVRAGDVVARIGGDEFVVVVSAIEVAQDVLTIAQKILAGLQAAIHVKRHELFATPSIGVALFPRDGHDADELLRNADTAMYQAKNAGRNAVRFFELAMMQVTEQYIKTESSLRHAVERREFVPYYQPVVDLESGTLEQLELLVRWRHPELGLVEPSDFIAVAEEAGLIGAIGLSMLRTACQQLRAWQQRGLAVPRLAINLSALQFRDRELLERLTSLLREEQIAPSRVELEITETVLMQGGEHTLATLRAFADTGFSLAIDDFGSGYSSLSYLKRFPVTRLKIDQSFIRDMTQDADDEAIVRTIVALAKTLRLATTAEGVETPAQRDALRRLGCDCAQGYLFARPLPAAEFEVAVLGSARPTVA